jgi:hypothetical protein
MVNMSFGAPSRRNRTSASAICRCRCSVTVNAVVSVKVTRSTFFSCAHHHMCRPAVVKRRGRVASGPEITNKSSVPESTMHQAMPSVTVNIRCFSSSEYF